MPTAQKETNSDWPPRKILLGHHNIPLHTPLHHTPIPAHFPPLPSQHLNASRSNSNLYPY
jgi:hypothetical protein